jgi:N-acyl-D-aspartate/D-glutamate deacylase
MLLTKYSGAGDNLMLYTHYVLETGILTIEEAVHSQTGKLAGHFGFTDRGEIVSGK